MPTITSATIDVVTAETVVLCLVVVAALGFDFTNGFHDTGNAMATSIATGALRPKVAVLLSGGMWLRSRRAPVDHNNVNDEWEAEAPREPVAAGTR